MNRTGKIIHAEILGAIAFSRGMKAIHRLDPEFMDMLKGIPGTTAGFKEANALMNAWAKGWHTANADA